MADWIEGSARDDDREVLRYCEKRQCLWECLCDRALVSHEVIPLFFKSNTRPNAQQPFLPKPAYPCSGEEAAAVEAGATMRSLVERVATRVDDAIASLRADHGLDDDAGFFVKTSMRSPKVWKTMPHGAPRLRDVVGQCMRVSLS